MRSMICILLITIFYGCTHKIDSQLSLAETRKNEINACTKDRHIVLEILDRPYFRDAAPVAIRISFSDYLKIKERYILKMGRYEKGSSLKYTEREEGNWQSYSMTLEAFDKEFVWIAELKQKGKGQDWVARYQLYRNPEVDEEFRIQQILEKRSTVLGGVKYGMSVDEVIAMKGMHFKINHHAESGSAHIIYDDVTISVRQWHKENKGGRVVSVETTTDRTRVFMKNFPYEDEKTIDNEKQDSKLINSPGK